MGRFLSVIFTFVVVFGLSTAHSSATEHDGKLSFCKIPWGSEISTSSATETKRSLRIVSECKVINPKTLDVSENHALTTFLKETEKALWDNGRLPKDILYRYTLTIVNDWGNDIVVNLSHWKVVHSPYTWVTKGFVVDIPSCSYAHIQFLSPWAPELYESPVNIGRYDNGEWSTEGAGATNIPTPVWYQYFSEGFEVGRLSPSEAQTKTCSSK